MSATQDYVALDWIKGEITQTLERAQYALEAVAEAPDDSSSMRSCLTAIHQAHGTLKMVELEGPTQVAGEMEALAQALMNSAVPDEPRAQEILMQVILQMPGYLDRIQREQQDSPDFVVPAINNLRVARGEAKLEGATGSEDHGLNPLFLVHPAADVIATFEKQKGHQNSRKIRQRYQQALIALLKKEQPRENLNLMGKAFSMLVKMCGVSAKGNFFRLALAVVEGVSAGAIKLDAKTADKFKRVDAELKDLASRGASSLGEVSAELGSELLSLVHDAKTETPRISAVKSLFSTQGFEELGTEDINFGPDDETLSTVAKIIIEELHGVTDKLDLYVRSTNQDADNIYQLVPSLEQIASTLTVVGMTEHQSSILNQVDVIKRLESEGSEPNEGELLEMAKAFLQIESSLSQATGDSNDGDEGDSFGDLNEAMASVIRETRNTLAISKDQVIDFISADFELSKIQTVPENLRSLGGGLSVINQQRSCDILNAAADYIEKELIEEQLRPELSQMDDLADAITSVDYYLERLLESSSDPYLQMIEVAETAVAKLGYAVDRVDSEPSVENAVETTVLGSSEVFSEDLVEEVVEEPAEDLQQELAEDLVQEAEEDIVAVSTNEDAVIPVLSAEETLEVQESNVVIEVDDEILEIFIEEAQEVLETIREQLPLWRTNPADIESLAEIRRAFHTLKGSGRMVGATVMGEFAWSVENMLNRVMDDSIQAGGELFEFLVTVVDRIPEGIETFQQGRQHEYHVEELVSKAEAIASGEVLAKLDPPEPELADKTSDEIEPSLEPAIEPPVDEDFTLEELDEETFAIGVPLLNEQLSEQLSESLDDSLDDLGDESGEEELLEEEQIEESVDDQVDDGVSVFEGNSEISPDSIEEELEGVEEIRVEEIQLEDLADEEIDADEVEVELEESIGTETSAIDSSDFDLDELLVEEEVGEASDAFEIVEASEEIALIEPELLETGLLEPEASELETSDIEDSVEVDVEANPVIEFAEPELEEQEQELESLEPQWDPELDEIFVAEANEKIGLLKEYASGQGTVTPDVIAAFHTLKGSAGMAGVTSIARLATPMEKWSNDLFMTSSIPTEDFISSVNRSIELMETCLGDLASFRAEMPGVDEMVLHLSELGDTESIEEFQLFDFENIRVLSKPIEILENWDVEQISIIVRELEDACAQAVELEQSHLRDMASALLGTYGNLFSRPDSSIPPESETLGLLIAAHEGLILMFDAIAASQEVDPALEVVLALESLDFNAHDTFDSALIESPAIDALVADVEEEIESDTDLPAKLEDPELVSLPEDDIDLEVLVLFLEEADELIEGIDQSILEWSENPKGSDHLDNILRFLHTMKGGARLAGLNSLGEYTHNFETELIELQTKPRALDEVFFGSLNTRQDEITRRIGVYARFAEGTATEVEMAEMQQSKAAEIGSSIEPDIYREPIDVETSNGVFEDKGDALALAANLPDDDVDLEILSIFIEEAEELLESIDQSILDWSGKTSDQTYLDNLLRHLHTLKGGARLAGLNSLGEYSHNLETFLIGVQQNPIELNEDFFAQLNHHQDEITRRIAIYKKMSDGSAEEDEVSSLGTTGDFSGDRTEKTRDEGSINEASSVGTEASVVDSGIEKRTPATAPAQEMVRVSAELLDELVSLAGETSITRGRIEQQISDFAESLDEMEDTIVKIREQVRRLEIEAESRETVFRSHSKDAEAGFDELELDRYTMLQEISRSLSEGSSDMMDLKDTLLDKSRDAETLLHQQARLGSELQEGLTRTRMVPFARLIPRLRRIVRQISSEVEKSVRFDAFNVEGELDRTVLERIVAPLEHMLRNAVDHGIESKEQRIAANKPETGRISLRLSREGGYVVLTISDDGGGIDVEAVKRKAIERGLINSGDQVTDHEAMQFVMNAGFSTAQKLTQISGRGVGMDVVNSEIKQLGGSVSIDSTFGVGTEFSIRIPFTVSINRALMVVIQEETYAVPLNTIEGIVRVSPYELEAYYQPDAPMFEYAGQPYRLTYMGKLLSKSENPSLEGQTSPLPVILARSGDLSVALQVDKVIGSREVVVKTLGRQFDQVGGISGATVLGDGSVVVILDVLALVQSADAETQQIVSDESSPVDTGVKKVLIVDDSVTVRKVTSRLMERQGWEVATAKDGLDAVEQLQDIYPDIVLLDIEMPKMDGFEVLRTVRRDERLKDLPVIMITSRTGEKHKQQAFELGVNSYLGKPFQEAGLMSTIAEVLAQVKK